METLEPSPRFTAKLIEMRDLVSLFYFFFLLVMKTISSATRFHHVSTRDPLKSCQVGSCPSSFYTPLASFLLHFSACLPTMPKERKRKSPTKGKHRPEHLPPGPQGVSGLRTLKDRLAQIRFNIWRSKHQPAAGGQAAQAPPSGRIRGLLSLRQKLGSTLGGSYRFVMNRLAILRHLHPGKGKGTNILCICFAFSLIRQKGHWLPSQLVRWDLLGVSLSWMWGKVNSAPLPRWARTPLYKSTSRSSYSSYTNASLFRSLGICISC